MRFGVLGPVTTWTDAGEAVTVPGLKVRVLLADLLAHEGRVVSTDRLVEDLWGDRPPANPVAALQVRVSQLRRTLQEAEPGGRDLVVSRAPGYALAVDPDVVDSVRFARLAAEGRFAEGLELWRGAPFAEFADAEFLQPVIARLEEARLSAVESHAEERLDAGERVEVADLLAEHPLRERLRAVHMRSLYRKGLQSEALASYADLRERLADELGLDPSPELAALYERILRQDPELSGRGGRPRTNVPAAVGDLIGREGAVAEVGALLGTARLVTLTGSGGVGKTSLALEVGRRLLDAYPDGAWIVELAPYERDATSLAEAVLASLDIRADSAGPLERLVEALRDRRLLVVLDNCEHVVDQAAGLAERLLGQVPGLRILATSREPLNVAGEALWSVPALALPDGSELAAVARADAVRLFLARATASTRGFTLDAGNAGSVAQLCRRLDGIPLALELAATRVRSLGVQEIVARLDDRFRLLAGFQRGAPARQQTLTAMIDWSWTLLTDAERVVLRRLSVHTDGCTLDAAEAVCGEPGVDVMDVLVRLVDRSLVVVVEGSSGTRYRLLESVAAYCLRRLEDAEDVEVVRGAHTTYYTEFAMRAETHLRGVEQTHWMRRLDAEAANLRAALDAAPAAGALRLVNALAWYWFLRGRLSEGRRSLAAALDAAGEAPADERAQATAWHAGFAMLLGETEVMPAEPQKAALGIADPGARARAQWFFGLCLADLAFARELTDAALATFREIGDRWGEAASLSRHARHAFTVRDLETLERDGTESERIFRELGDRWGQLQATEWLGGLAETRGDAGAAVRLFTEGLRLAEEMGLWPDAVRHRSWLGWMAMSTADYEGAMEHCGEALRLANEQGYQEGRVFAAMGYGFSARRAGLLEIAEEHLKRLLDGVARDGDPPLFLPTTLVELGYVRELRGDAASAHVLFLEALAAARKIGDPRTTAFTVEALAATSPPGDGARLLGLAAAARDAHRTPSSRSEADEVRRITAGIVAALGRDAFDAAYARGRELTFDAVPLDGAVPCDGAVPLGEVV
ncbi:BTAD domain-containing putative transcriptional regulator [Actinomadura xylanilytica]|uniref:BTAD domain-containing putative transcriptional regulator n=1 Tax=Actinomadura xylanilytica TaxID=887459 RepID=UPI00255B33C0|nr:BTAD domain-containing putative transcriptional regulator [Actinomadura xylanilytica]MDL4777566.1 BTAD domain-containing putative transcriptional regulator [Actinomadura xylanilytica]